MQQMDHKESFAFTLGQMVGLQKHDEVRQFIAHQLGSEQAAEEFAKQLFQIAEGFYRQ